MINKEIKNINWGITNINKEIKDINKALPNINW